MAATEYIVFRLVDASADSWEIVKKYTASSADAAIRQAALEAVPGTYAAAPARSWQPRTVKVEARASFAKDES
jgi:hypothetical protein